MTPLLLLNQWWKTGKLFLQSTKFVFQAKINSFTGSPNTIWHSLNDFGLPMDYFVTFHNYILIFYSGIPQGKLIKRQRLPKNDLGEYWHWKDFNLGICVTFYGKVFFVCDCDGWTRVRKKWQ